MVVLVVVRVLVTWLVVPKFRLVMLNGCWVGE
jgi:hypothetical protein